MIAATLLGIFFVPLFFVVIRRRANKRSQAPAPQMIDKPLTV